MTQLDNTFDLERFKNLCRLIVANRWKRDSLGALLLFTLTLIGTYLSFRIGKNTLSTLEGGVYMLNKVDSVILSEQASRILGFLLAVIGAGYILSYVKELSPKHPRTSVYLMLPVSAFERITSIFLFGTVLYCVVGFLLLLLGINAGIFIAGLKIETFSFSFIPLFKGQYWLVFTAIVLIQQNYLIGGFYFRKAVFMKTTLMILLISAGYQLINSLVLAVFTKIASPFDLHFLELLNISTKISSHPMTDANNSIFHSSYLIFPVVFICFWSFAYFKIKEKEIK